MKIPQDILDKIEQTFRNQEKDEVLEIIKNVFKDTINVGKAHLSRSIIIISDGELSKIKDIIKTNYFGDPRDVINEANTLTNGNFNYGITQFNS